MSRHLKMLLALCVLAIGVVGAQRSSEYLRRSDFFKARDFQVVGNMYLTDEVIMEIASFPLNTSVLDDLSQVELLLEEHEMILEASVENKWWWRSRVVLTVEEKIPLALLAGPLLRPVDREGNTLPLDPGQYHFNLPLMRIERGQGAGLEGIQIRAMALELDRLVSDSPSFVRELSEISIDGDGNAEAILDRDVVVRFRPPLLKQTLNAGLTALADAKKRQFSDVAIVIDLRFEDQVVVSYEEGDRP
ncbi:MAG TPA: hypothetical protein EYQ69_03045 [Gemmatimonadetes bacterium]|nr:hypothetical protein [Gemmatimonadota bacterium]